MKNLLKESKKIKVAVNPSLNDVDVSKVAPEKLEEANRTLSRIKMPESYYEQQRNKA